MRNSVENARNFIESLLSSLQNKDSNTFSKHFRKDRPFFDIFINKKTVHSFEELMQFHQEAFFNNPITSFFPKILHLTYYEKEGVCVANIEAEVIRSKESKTRDLLVLKTIYDTEYKDWFVNEIFNVNIASL